ncbi:hypothetical protein [Rummeliibacillus sp. TYF005]|uniref:hypothetical protein n=1 Tax=Rummeliibacillus sp. TYF005 TaxID=2058214 RepID=UPI0019CF86F9|nr:hypothetical protein [Rummeliibacillus sp. TYF005]
MTQMIEQLRDQLMSKIDTGDLMEVKKVQRYIELLKIDALCDEAIQRDGATVTIENGSQRFIKSHPALNDKTKINSQLIALEKTFNFISEGTTSTASTVEEQENFTEDDLI